MASPGWPDPEIHARAAREEDPIPSALARLRNLATLNGWNVGVTYARGHMPIGPLPWTPGPVVDSFALRARRGDLRLVVTYAEGRFSTAWLAVPAFGSTPLKHGQVKAMLASAP